MMKNACRVHNLIPFLFTLFSIDNKRAVLAEIFNVIYPHQAERIEYRAYLSSNQAALDDCTARST